MLGDVAGRTSSSSAAAPPTSRRGSPQRGARPVGLDRLRRSSRPRAGCRRSSASSSRSSRRSAEDVPLPDASFDLVLSDYGALDLGRPVPVGARGRAAAPARRPARLLRNSTLVILCQPADDAAHGAARPRRSRHAPDRVGRHGEVEFNLAHGDWIDSLRANGFDVEPDRALRARRRRDARLLRVRDGGGRGTGRRRRSGQRGKERERSRRRRRSSSRRRARSGARSSSSCDCPSTSSRPTTSRTTRRA